VFGVQCSVFGLASRGRDSAGVGAEGGWRHPLPPRECRAVRSGVAPLSPSPVLVLVLVLEFELPCECCRCRALSGGNRVEVRACRQGGLSTEYELGARGGARWSGGQWGRGSREAAKARRETHKG
jgi:hypothetical protein